MWHFRIIISCILLLLGMTIYAETTDVITNNSYDVIFKIEEVNTVNNEDFAVIIIEDNSLSFAFGKNIRQISISQNTVSGPLVFDQEIQIQRRGDEVKVIMGDKEKFFYSKKTKAGVINSYTTSANLKIIDLEVREFDSVYFTDDFMRDIGDSAGDWRSLGGDWGIHLTYDVGSFLKLDRQSSQNATGARAQNPFNWTGKADEVNELALSVVGDNDWEDYTFETSFRAEKDSIVGGMVHYDEEKDSGILFLWSSNSDDKNSMCLYNYEYGTYTKIGEAKTYLLPNEWYRLKMETAFSGIIVYIDDYEVIRTTDVGNGSGAVALVVKKGSAVFDDIAVFGKDIDMDLLYEIQAEQNAQGFQTDRMMSFWNSPERQWSNHLDTSYYKHNIYGDYVWISGNLNVNSWRNGTFILGLNAMYGKPKSGYRAELSIDYTMRKNTLRIYQNEEVLAEKDLTGIELRRGTALRFLRDKQTIKIFLDDEEVLSAVSTKNPEGYYPTISGTGIFNRHRNFSVYSYNMLEYTFSTAPVNWYTEGSWMTTFRWACSPEWSFLSGWGRGPAALWHKQIFTGDHSISAYMGYKVEYPRETNIYFDRQRDLMLTICGDGINPISGYTGWYRRGSGNTFSAESGEVYSMAILKDGVIVTEQDIPKWISDGWHHTSWYNLSLTKEGNKITLKCRSNPVLANIGATEQEIDLSFDDPNPLISGSAAIWAYNTGISIAKAEVSFKEQPITRTTPRITIDDAPYYPDWSEVGTPIIVRYDAIASSNGLPTELYVEPKELPIPLTDEISFSGHTLTFTPKAIGNYWFEIRAFDNDEPYIYSPASHIHLKAFDPVTYKATSDGAIVLYKFDEGDGDVIIDHSGVQPQLNLEIKRTDTTNNATVWRIDRGIYLGADSHLMSSLSADKLCAIADSKQFTLEVWQSLDSMQPDSLERAYQTSVSIMSWDEESNRNPNQANMSISGFQNKVYLLPKGSAWRPNYENMNTPGVNTNLHHFVITWDGRATSLYEDGEYKWSQYNINWVPQNNAFNKDYKLHVGNLANGFSPIYGSLYFFAMYNRAMSAEEILNNYKAGPSR